MKKMILLLMIGLSLVAVACATTKNNSNDTALVEVDNNDQPTRLNEDYADALPIMTQLALGTIQLDETVLAVDEALAVEILPLWQAVQNLSSSETAASAEVNAVLNQIQDTMSPEQVVTIVEMTLTADSMTKLLESGAITFGRGAGRRPGAGGEGGFSLPAGVVPGQGGAPGGGGFGPPGGGGFGGGNPSEDDIATREAEFASGDGFAQFQEQAMVGAVVRHLQTVAGEVPENPQGDLVNAIYTAVSDTIGIDVETLQAELADGSSLVDVIEANGGEVTAVREAIITNLNELPNASDLDVELIADNWLSE